MKRSLFYSEWHGGVPSGTDLMPCYSCGYNSTANLDCEAAFCVKVWAKVSRVTYDLSMACWLPRDASKGAMCPFAAEVRY